MSRYEELKSVYRDLRNAGYLPAGPSPEECAEWAYGTAVIENAAVTREMALRAAEASVRTL